MFKAYRILRKLLRYLHLRGMKHRVITVEWPVLLFTLSNFGSFKLSFQGFLDFTLTLVKIPNAWLYSTINWTHTLNHFYTKSFSIVPIKVNSVRFASVVYFRRLSTLTCDEGNSSFGLTDLLVGPTLSRTVSTRGRAPFNSNTCSDLCRTLCWAEKEKRQKQQQRDVNDHTQMQN